MAGESTIKVHITLLPGVRGDEQAKQEALAAVVDAGDLTEVNERRFERYGIITGLMPMDRVSSVLALRQFVADVAHDEVKFAKS
ncbi:MAG: hypothetical protein KIT58_01750 [Planctomycetota bacterium]|nr:hypothetical protein [Planctomycetota bacterium]